MTNALKLTQKSMKSLPKEIIYIQNSDEAKILSV
jgi:hypothetical protein